MYIHIHISDLQGIFFFVNKKQNKTKQNIIRSYKGLSSQETSMISMLPEKLD